MIGNYINTNVHAGMSVSGSGTRTVGVGRRTRGDGAKSEARGVRVCVLEWGGVKGPGQPSHVRNRRDPP